MDTQRKGQPMSATTNPASKPKITPPARLAAVENLSPEFMLILSNLGFEVVIVRFQALHESPIWEHPGIELALDQELRAVGAGQFDSEIDMIGSRWFFFHVADLSKAMQTFKRSLEARGLLEITTLLHAETATELRVWYPETAELINTTAEA